MRVLHVGETCGFGGAETVTVSLIREQRKQGITADAFFYTNAGGAVQFQDLCDVWFADRHPLAEIVLSGRYDVVHLVAAAVPRAKRNLRQAVYRGAVVITHHGWFDNCMGSRYVVSVSRFGAEEIQARCPEPVYVVYNGIDVSRFSPAKRQAGSDKPIVAWVGRAADSQKDYSGLVALAVSGAASGFRIIAVDGSPEEPGSGNWLPPGSETVRQLPWSEMPGFYRMVAASGGFLLSTAKVEWCPMNILEAQACGCPVVAPSVGGIPEIVLHRETGYIYHKKGGLPALLEGLDWLYEGDHYEKTSREAKAHIARSFTAEKMSNQYLAIYRDAIGASKTSAFEHSIQRILLVGLRSTHGIRNALRRGKNANA